jgi:hypothetical protein
MVRAQPLLDFWEGGFDGVEVGGMRREKQKACAAFLNHIANASSFVNLGVVYDKHRVWKWPFVHVREQSLNKLPEEVLGDRILGDLKMENTIEGYCGENRVLRSAKGKLEPASAFTASRPSIGPLCCKPVEIAFVCKYKLLWTEICMDKSLEVFALLLVFLQSQPRDLQKLRALIEHEGAATHRFHGIAFLLEGTRDCLQGRLNTADLEELSLQLSEGNVWLALDTITK